MEDLQTQHSVAETQHSTAFEQNLASYIEANATSAPTDFKVKRELDIARHALEESLALHGLVTKLLNTAVAQLQGSSKQEDLYKLISLANNLEERHRKLQNSAKIVASIAKNGAEIESLLASKLDAAQVYSILLQLPSIILKVSQRFTSVEIANSIANSMDEEIEKTVNVLTYRVDSQSESSKGVVEEEIVGMLNSVPVGSVVEPSSEEANAIRTAQ
jgi:predicted NodU family carbamoyl transferase